MPREKKSKPNGNGANLGFEAKLWAAADKLRNNMDAGRIGDFSFFGLAA